MSPSSRHRHAALLDLDATFADEREQRERIVQAQRHLSRERAPAQDHVAEAWVLLDHRELLLARAHHRRADIERDDQHSLSVEHRAARVQHRDRIRRCARSRAARRDGTPAEARHPSPRRAREGRRERASSAPWVHGPMSSNASAPTHLVGRRRAGDDRHGREEPLGFVGPPLDVVADRAHADQLDIRVRLRRTAARSRRPGFSPMSESTQSRTSALQHRAQRGLECRVPELVAARLEACRRRRAD